MSGNGDVIVRMYNVGFGDSFLLLIPSGSKKLKVLVDCGSIAAGPHSMSTIVSKIVEDIKDPDGVPRLDVVVVTHRHRDHVSGFADDAWADVEVGEVWMPWTENPKDPEATRIREHQASMALHLAAAFAPSALAISTEPSIDGWTNEQHQMALNALANEKAMATLHQGFAGTPTRRFLPLKKNNQPLRVGGVTFHVAGPAFTEDVIRDMDPPAGHSYLAMVDDSEPGVVNTPRLFDDYWTWNPEKPPLTDKERAKIDAASSDLTDSALASLESAVNGTSLFFIMQVNDVNFVFPGDAQWGTWQYVLNNPTYQEMLKDTRFYKIGHHGSHNATPVDFVEELDSEIVAMASVRPITKWKDIPRKPLLAALHEHGKIARSDDLKSLDKVFTEGDKGLYVETTVPTKGQRRYPGLRSGRSSDDKIHKAKAFVADARVPLAPPQLGIAADPASDPAFDAAKNQAAVVGADLISFAKGISAETRKDLVNASLLAQLVAKKRCPAPNSLDEWTAWYEAYFDVLSNIGFAVQDKGFATYSTESESFEAHKEIIAIATSLLAGAPTALVAITKTLEALQKMDESSPWITLFDRESRSANTARFQVTIAGADEADKSVFVSMIAFGLEATSRITQVLFFKFRKNTVTLKNHSGKVSLDADLLAAVRDDISKKLVGFASKFVRGLPDL